jgi:hypothetical protein
MVTWTFDLLALVVGFIVGAICGALLYCTVEMRDGGSWDKGFSNGWKAKHDYLKMKEKEDIGNGQDTERIP